MASTKQKPSQQRNPTPSDPDPHESPSWSQQAERGVIGSMILQAECIDDVRLVVGASDFFDDEHRTLFEAICAEFEKRGRVDETLLLERLTATGLLANAGGFERIVEIVGATPNAAHARYYADIVRNHSIVRQVVSAASETLNEAAHPGDLYANGILDRAQARMMEISAESMTNQQAVSLNDLLHSAMDEIDKRAKGDKPPAVPTGFDDLDDSLGGGFRKGEMVVVAGRPGSGKSALCGCISLNIATEGYVVMYVTLEMNELDLTERLLSVQSGVGLTRMRSGNLRPGDRDDIVRAAGEISQSQLYMLDSSTLTVQQIASHARMVRRKRKRLDVLVIDYLQIVEPSNNRDSKYDQITAISVGLKHLARELKIPVICAAQVNRECEKRPDKKPRLGDLRDSGAIEQDADVIVFTHRPVMWSENPDDRDRKKLDAELIIAKQRNGPTGTVKLLYRDSLTRFENLPSDQQAAMF